VIVANAFPLTLFFDCLARAAMALHRTRGCKSRDNRIVMFLDLRETDPAQRSLYLRGE
jgi:hypothetical protein